MQIKKFFLGLAIVFTVSACNRQASPTHAVSVDPSAPLVTVYKSPTCGCCNKWITHLEENGFRVEAKDTKDVILIKEQQGIPKKLSSCHTALVNGYFVEGHVPADVIHKMLAEKPAIKGLSVPGMPVGSPGMEGAFSEDYEVLALSHDGTTSVYAKR